MRLWHPQLIPYLPRQQRISQWRELNSIYKNNPNHRLINYIYSYPKSYLKNYSDRVIDEMLSRGYKVNLANYNIFFEYTSAEIKHYPEHRIR